MSALTARVGRLTGRSSGPATNTRLSWAGWTLFGIALLLFVAWPILQLQGKAFADGAAAYKEMFGMSRLVRVAQNTLLLGVGSAAVALILGTVTAFCAHRSPARIRGLLSMIPIMPLVVPAAAFVTGWIFLLSPNAGYINVLLRKTPMFSDRLSGPIDIYSMPWIVVLTGFALTSFVHVFVSSGLNNLGSDFEDAARTHGGSSWRTLFTITLPLLRPSFVYAAVIVFLLACGQFTAVLLLGQTKGIDVITTEIFRLLDRTPANYGLGAALGAPILILGFVAVLLQRNSLKHQERYVVQTGKTGGRSHRSSYWYAAPVVLYGLITTVLPVLALLHVAMSPFWTGGFNFDNLSLDNFRQVIVEDAATRGAIVNTMIATAIAVACVSVLGFLVALSQLPYIPVPAMIRRTLDFVVMLPLGVPAVLLGFGILYVYTQPYAQLYGTRAIVVVAYVTLMLPYAVRTQLSVMSSYGRDFYDAARTSGAGPVYAVGRIVLPLARQGIAGGIAIMIVLLFHEFTVSLMVSSPQTELLGARLYAFWSGGTYPDVAVMALLMVVVTMVGVSAAMVIAGRNVLNKL